MTCLIAWIGVDTHGPSSCYLAADSRFSWEKSVVWDGGRKVFCSKKSPDTWGYYGDVIFPTVLISQIIDVTDERHFSGGLESQQSFEWAFRNQLAGYPLNKIGPFGVVHCHRIGNGTKSTFQIFHLTWSPTSEWKSETFSLPTKSGLIKAFGSGRAEFDQWLSKFSQSDVCETSRAIFQAFCQTLENGSDPHTGGAPQLVSLFRQGNGRQHGIIWNSEVWFAGLRLPEVNRSVEVINCQFERCDPTTKQRLKDAQPQPLPPLE